MYKMYLETEDKDHADVIFEELLLRNDKNICPEHGDVTNLNGFVQCSVHIGLDGESDEEEGPFL